MWLSQPFLPTLAYSSFQLGNSPCLCCFLLGKVEDQPSTGGYAQSNGYGPPSTAEHLLQRRHLPCRQVANLP